MDNSPSMLKATLIGGAAFGFLGAVPLVGALNCACCSLVVGAGFVAAFLYSRDCEKQHTAFSPGSGAVVGLVAGMFYAVTNAIVSALFHLALGSNIEETLAQLEDRGLAIPPEAEPFFDFLTRASPILLVGLLFCFMLLIGAVFSTLGGVIGGAVFKVQPPPAPGMGTAPPPPAAPPSES